MRKIANEFSVSLAEQDRAAADASERNRELERNLSETREKLQWTVDHLNREIRRRIAINRSLENALQNLRNVLERSASVVIIVDHAGVTRYANAMAAEMLGRDRMEMIGQMFGSPLTEEDVDLDLVKEDGTRGVARMRVIPTVWEGDEAQLMLLRDFTTEKRQELELKRVSRALNAVYRASEIVVRSEDEKSLLDGVCQSIVSIGGYNMVWVGLLEGEQQDLVPVAYAREQTAPRTEILMEQERACGHIRKALQNSEIAVTTNKSGAESKEDSCQALSELGCDSVASVPLIWRDRPRGLLSIYTMGADSFSSQELEMLWRLADDLSYGLASLRTRAEREHMQENLRSLSARLVQLQEEERRSLARELHDEIGQSLTALKIAIDRNSNRCPVCREDLSDVSREVLRLIEQVRNLSLSLRPTMLDDLGLVPTLRWHLDRYSSQTGMKIAFKSGRLSRSIPRDITTAAYRVVQEALTNAARHARASEVKVRVGTRGDVLDIEVKDDGVGFDLENKPQTGGAGLGGMRERVICLGGTLTIDSSPGNGTCILAELPLPEGKATARRKKL